MVLHEPTTLAKASAIASVQEDEFKQIFNSVRVSIAIQSQYGDWSSINHFYPAAQCMQSFPLEMMFLKDSLNGNVLML